MKPRIWAASERSSEEKKKKETKRVEGYWKGGERGKARPYGITLLLYL
jgi:hypothetical protein